jgi:ketosteroid isomerase-like protein
MAARSLSVALVALLSVLHAFAQQNPAPATCLGTEQAVREVIHRIWAAYRNRDLATLDKLIDDDAINTDDGGTRTGKQEALAAVKKPEGNLHNETDEQPEDFRVVFTSGVAILNYTKRWTDYEKKMGINWSATSRVTVVLVCKNGEWRRVAFHETEVQKKDRQPSTSAIDGLDDYVGHYRFGEKGDKGEISIVRKGDRLSETWADEGATEILPGKYDTFFSREDGVMERFVRDKSGKVIGILYTLGDDELEARRVP